MTDLASTNQYYRDLSPDIKRDYSIEQYYADMEAIAKSIIEDDNRWNVSCEILA
jgi:hypothetical protein